MDGNFGQFQEGCLNGYITKLCQWYNTIIHQLLGWHGSFSAHVVTK